MELGVSVSWSFVIAIVNTSVLGIVRFPSSLYTYLDSSVAHVRSSLFAGSNSSNKLEM